MPCLADAWPDWREEEQYAWLIKADRAAFAWEWTRRNDSYRRAFDEAQAFEDPSAQDRSAAVWGLHRFEQPGLPAANARPIWRRDVLPSVLEVAAEEAGNGLGENLFKLQRLGDLATLSRSATGEEHLLLSDGLRSIRLDIVEGSVTFPMVLLHYRIAGLAAAGPPLMVLRQLLALWRTGRFSPALHPVEVRARRWAMLLRARDGLAAAATQRELAQYLISREAGEPRWRVAAPTVRARVQRLVRGARLMAAGGYWSLLRGAAAL